MKRAYGRRAFFRRVMGAPAETFFTASIGPAPALDIDRWSLALDGLVESPLALSRRALHRLPAVERAHTVACIGGHAAGSASWRGVPLALLLERAGAMRAARRARFWAADGYSTAVDLWWLTREGAILAYEMNGAPLPAAHGAPLRLLVPGLYGQKMPKWITRIELIDYAYAGYWERRGWSDTAAVKTRAWFQAPAMYTRVRGAVALRGAAYAGDRAIDSVEVGVDGGPWQTAELDRPTQPTAWTLWRLRWTPGAPGSYTFRVRATDARGTTQAGKDARAFPAGTDAIDRLVLLCNQ